MRTRRMLRQAGMLLAGLGAIGLLTYPASASIGPDPATGPVVVANGDGTYTYTYNVYLTYADQATNARGSTFVTFFDIDGLIAGSENTRVANPQFVTWTEQALGGNAVGQVVPDDPNFQNATFQYTGPTETTGLGTPGSPGSPAISLGEVSFKSTVDRLDSGYFTGQTLGGATGSQGYTLPAGNQAHIDMPLGAPEPGTVSAFAFAGIGLAVLMTRARKGRAMAERA